MSASRRNSSASGDRVLETNIENLRRMVGYCEDEVYCRRLLQLVHFGEKFNPANCQKTCDNCSKVTSWIEKDVTDISRQLVELVISTGKQYSTSHILEVYRGSLSQNVKKHKHDTLNLHGAGKHLAKGEAARILHHLVIKDILVEDVKKSDIYGSVSSILKVNEFKAHRILTGEEKITMRFPAPVKLSKSTKSDATPAKGLLVPERVTPAPMDINGAAQNEVDLNLSAKLYSALRMLRTMLVKEAGEGVMAYHIFGNATLQQLSKRVPRTKEELLEINGIGKAKVTKYGDRVLETIESTISDYLKANGNNSNHNNDAKKKRRGSTKNDPNVDDEFTETTIQLRKRVSKTASDQCSFSDSSSISLYGQRCIDDDLDGYEMECEETVKKSKPRASGRIPPKWLSKSNSKENNLFHEDAM